MRQFFQRNGLYFSNPLIFMSMEVLEEIVEEEKLPQESLGSGKHPFYPESLEKKNSQLNSFVSSIPPKNLQTTEKKSSRESLPYEMEIRKESKPQRFFEEVIEEKKEREESKKPPSSFLETLSSTPSSFSSPFSSYSSGPLSPADTLSLMQGIERKKIRKQEFEEEVLPNNNSSKNFEIIEVKKPSHTLEEEVLPKTNNQTKITLTQPESFPQGNNTKQEAPIERRRPPTPFFEEVISPNPSLEQETISSSHTSSLPKETIQPLQTTSSTASSSSSPSPSPTLLSLLYPSQSSDPTRHMTQETTLQQSHSSQPSHSLTDAQKTSSPSGYKNQKGTRTEDLWQWTPLSFQEMSSSPLSTIQYIQQLIREDSKKIKKIVALPEGVNPELWQYEHLRQFTLELSLLVVELNEVCDYKSCPQMKATDEWLYLCAAHKQPNECSAIDYINHTLDSSVALLNNSKHFPSRLSIPKSSMKHLQSIARRLYRIFAHTYFHHRTVYEEFENQSSLCKRFVHFSLVYKLIPKKLLIIPD